MKVKKFVLIGVGAVVIVGAVIVGKSLLGGNKEVGTIVDTEIIAKDTIVTTVSAKGEVSLLNTELIYSATAAEVDEVLVEKNDIVKKGDVLVRYTKKSRETIENKLRDAELSYRSAQLSLNSARIPATDTEIEADRLAVVDTEKSISDLEIAIEDLNRDIENAKIKIADAEKDLSNAQSLLDLGALSQTELDKSTNALRDAKDALTVLESSQIKNESSLVNLKESLTYKQRVYQDTQNSTSDAKSQNSIAQQQILVEQARVAVQDLKKELADFQQEIVSPIDGTITSLSVSKGEVPSTEKSLMEIANIDDYVIKVDVNERNASKIELGQIVELKGSVLGDEVLSGKVTKIGNIAEEKSTSSGTEKIIPVEITIDKKSNVLKPGFSVEAVITTAVKENIVVAPILATLKDSEGNNYVFVVKEDNTLEKRIVELGLYADMTVEVSNLAEGEKIVSQPAIDMYDGMVIMEMPSIAEGDQAVTEGEQTAAEGDEQ